MNRLSYFNRVIEIIVVFIGLPLLYKFNLIPFHKSIPLFAVFLIYLIVLLLDKKFSRKKFGFNKYKNWKWIVIRGIVFLMITSVIVYVFDRDNFFIIPRQRFKLWLAIMILYPLWSAYTQELIYRAYFFHRFKKFIKNEKILILINAILFSYSHIIFGNWIAIVLTFFGSLLFTYTYLKSDSLMFAIIEHSIFGNIIFTVGLGNYFYLPLSS